MQKKTKRKIKRIIHNGILYVLTTVAALGFIITALGLPNTSGLEFLNWLVVFVVCGAWIGAVTWANVRLGNW